jgi:hypothetical protein
MYLNIFIGICAYGGIVLLLAAGCGVGDRSAGVDQEGRSPTRWARIGLVMVVLGVLLSATKSDAQMIMWPGQELAFCNGIGAISGGGTVCKHNIYEQRIEINHMNRPFYDTFWGAGTAASLLPPLCRIANVHRVTETVFEPGLVRVRTIPCSTGKSGPWIVVEVPES